MPRAISWTIIGQIARADRDPNRPGRVSNVDRLRSGSFAAEGASYRLVHCFGDRQRLGAALSAVVIPFAVHGGQAPHPRHGHSNSVRTIRRSDPLASATLGHPEGTIATAPKPPIKLLALPAQPLAGQLVRLVVLDPPAAASDYRWHLTDHGTDSLDSGANAQTTVEFTSPGIHRMVVNVAVGSVTHVGALALNVRRRLVGHLIGAHHPSRRAPRDISRRAPRRISGTRRSDPAAATRRRIAARPKPPDAVRRARGVGSVAGDPGVTTQPSHAVRRAREVRRVTGDRGVTAQGTEAVRRV